MGNFDFSQLLLQTQERFAATANNKNTVEQFLMELEKIRSEAEILLQQQSEGDRSLIACKPGCHACCVVNVSISLLEGISIVRFLRQWDPSDLKQITLRLDSLWRAVRGLDDDERLLLRRKCAFLNDQGCCTIYPVRPLFCRSISSTDPELCQAAVTSQVFGESQPILMHQFQQQLYEVLYFGVTDGLEQSDWDGRSFQLSGLIRYLLTHPYQETELLKDRNLSWNRIYP
jgi:Fe-S-cluster containining protein